ncbi:MAG: ATP-binding cassette subfamily F protein uup [Limisphaerales bacterium]
MPLLQLQKANLAFGHVDLLSDVDLVVNANEKVCLIGRNGTGKSSLLNTIIGEQPLDSGNIWLEDGIKIAKLAQEVPDGDDQTLYETVTSGLGNLSKLLADFHHVSQNVADDADLKKLEQLQEGIEQLDGWDVSARVDAVLSRLDLPADALMSQCSGGIRRRAMLGQALVSEPDLLILDEPTNHLDIASISALEEAIRGYSGAVIFVTHDRSFIDGIATRIIELDRGSLKSYPGTYAAYQKRKAQELEAEDDANKKFDQHLAEEEVWIRQGIKARRTRNEGRVRRLESLRKERGDRRNLQGRVAMSVDKGGNSGKIVLEFDDISFGFDDQTIVDQFSTTIMRGDRVGIIGPNGSGKSTLLRLMLGDLQPDTGTIRQGSQLNIAYFDQERMQLDPEKSVRDNLAPGTDQIQIGDRSQHVISYLRDFLFAPERANSPVKSLSGGERNRLLLARLFSKPANLLVLDEPTNDLDVETLELLEELLEAFTGTLLLVSHDRAFLDQTITSSLVLEGNGRVSEYVGGYSDWLRQTKKPTIKTPSKPTTEPKQVNEKPVRSNSTPKKSLSFDERKELKSLPAKIEKLENNQVQLSAKTTAPDFYKQDQSSIEPILEELSLLNTELEAAYARWEHLEAVNEDKSA